MRGFFTAGHCTSGWNAIGDYISQPFYGTVGGETVEPNFIPGGACPAGFTCRLTDATFVGYTVTPYNSVGIVGEFHKPTTSCTLPTVTCGLTVSGTTFLATGAAPVGMVGAGRSKLGRTTGWTAGPMVSTCTNTSFSHGRTGQPGNFLCQQEFSMGVLGGDSGGPVFVQSNATQIQIAGQVIARSTSGPITMFASPLSAFVPDGIPTFTFCAAGFGC